MLTFSERYLRPEAVQDDSQRMRVQLSALFDRMLNDKQRWDARQSLSLRTGFEVPFGGSGVNWKRFFEGGELRDVLDLITVVYFVLKPNSYQLAQSWIRNVSTIFNMQNVRYQIDAEGGVLLRVDENFEADRTATLAGLDGQRYNGARTEFDNAYRALAAEDPNGKQAVRGVFEACEVVFKLMFPGAQRLAAPQLGQHLSPFVAIQYATDRPAQQAADKLVQGFTDWVASAQFYRHGQGQEEPNQPPLEVAVTILSSGAAYLRWLVHLDKAKLAADT